MFWGGDVLVTIDNDLIHKVTSLTNEGCNLVNDKNMRKFVETNLKTKFDDKNMRVDLIRDIGIRILSKIIGYKLNHVSRVNLVPTRFLHVAYAMAMERKKLNMCEIVTT